MCNKVYNYACPQAPTIRRIVGLTPTFQCPAVSRIIIYFFIPFCITFYLINFNYIFWLQYIPCLRKRATIAVVPFLKYFWNFCL